MVWKEKDWEGAIASSYLCILYILELSEELLLEHMERDLVLNITEGYGL